MSEKMILVVDDNEDFRLSLEESILTPAGYEVKSVADGLSALTLVQEYKPALVITDQQMPNLTGIELIQRLRRKDPSIPTILVTSEGSEALAVEALRAGATDMLTKPFEPEEMLEAVKRAFAERERRLSDGLLKTKADKTATIEHRIHELEALSMIGRTVTAMLDLDEVLTTVVEAAVRLTGAEEGSLLLLEEETGELYMRASKNFDEDFATAFRLETRDSLAGKVVSTGEPVILDETTPKKIKTSYLVHSLIYVPLKVRGRVIGVLGVDNRKAGSVLSEKDMTVITAMADYAAIAIENARLFAHSEMERIQLETILRQIKNGVIVVDPDNRIRLINRTAQEAFGLEGDFLGRSIVEAFDEPKILKMLRTAGKVPHQDDIETADGRIFNLQCTPIEGVGQAIVLHDITHLKNLDRIKSEFVTTVSHDLRSPLTAILGYVELIERAGKLNEQQQEFTQRVRFSVQQITDLVTDLLDLGRIEAGLDIARENTPIDRITHYAVESLQGVAESQGVKLDIELDKGLPLVNGDPVRLRQMVGNLLDNAIKYTPEGGTVRVQAEAEGGQVILRVIDNGPGIPPADQPYLFDKFFRASNIPDDMPGTGLGLSIVKSIVDNHGGRIWVDSKLGEGTTFTVVLLAAEE
jgi:signal transduction histidine kinase/FixJ family two-component response regulator